MRILFEEGDRVQRRGHPAMTGTVTAVNLIRVYVAWDADPHGPIGYWQPETQLELLWTQTIRGPAPVDKSGATCKRCNQHNEYAAPNAAYVCFECRT